MKPGQPLRAETSLLFVGQELALNVARGLFTLLLGKQLYDATGSLWWFALAFLSELGMGLLLQGVAGATIDRFGARRTIRVAVAVAALAVALVAGAAHTWGFDARVLLALSAIFGATRPFIRSCVFALTKEMSTAVGIERMNARLQASMQVGQILGMLAAGLLMETHRLLAALDIIACAYVFAYLVFRVIDRGHPRSTFDTRHARRQTWRDLLGTLCTDRYLVALFLLGSFDFIGVSIFNLLLAPVVKLQFGDSPRWLTYLDLCFTVGAVVSGGLLSRYNLRRSAGLTCAVLAAACAAAVFAGFAFDSTPRPLILAVIVAYGGLSTVSTITWSVLLQEASPEAFKGRVASLRYIVNTACGALSVTLVTGVSAAGFREAAFVAALLMLGCAAVTAAIQTMKSFTYFDTRALD